MQGGDEGISPPPGLSPPGRVASSSGEASGPAVERLAANMMAQAQVEEGGRDVPDLSLKSPGLQDPESEIKVATSQGSVYTSAATFEELGLSKQLLDGLYQEMKFERPSRIQATTLPMILTAPYKSMIAQAHNGSGKTTCFVLAMLTRVDPERRVPQAVCICPTRELVNQNAAVVRQMGKYCTDIECVTTAEQSSGGAPGSYRREKVSAQIVVGTHGTLKTWVSKRMLELRDVRVIVFDEADEMLSGHGFGADSVRLVNDVRRAAGPDVQILLFSATFDEQVKSFAQRVASGSNHVFVPKEKLSLDVIKQYRVQCPTESAKHRVLKDVIFPNCTKLGQTIIFVRRRETAPRLKDMMVREGFTVTSIAGDMEHADRDRVVNEFREGTTRILISTDVLSRGFNVNQVTLVINYDLPVNRDGYPAYETYLHRIGRSGRFGRKGAAFNLVASREDAQIMDDISNYFRHPVPEILLDNEQDFITVLKEADLMGKDD